VSEKTKILIVDDSDFSRRTISEFLSDSPYQVIAEVASAQAAIEVISEKPVDIIITDIVMPEMSGIELTEVVTKNSRNISIIVISSLAQESIVMRAIHAGAQDFLQKPFSKEALIESIEKVIESKQGDFS
jgi:YesN/AraC family two-component response regulator